MADAIPVPVEEYDTWARFMAKVDKAGPVPEARPELGPCWVWTAARFQSGYGMFVLEGKRRRAHRVLYVWESGEPGLPLDHLCRNRACVNPDHLEPKTIKANVLAGEGITALNARKTECANGHALTPENTYVDPRGWRQCRECGREASRRSQARRRRLGLR
jgi:hypothetical protein